MATACHLAAPLGLAPLPRGCASAGVVAVVRCGSKIPRGVAVRATSGGEGATEEVPEIVKAAQDAWDKVEDKYAVATIGVAAIVALWTVVGAIKDSLFLRAQAIDKLPLLPGVLEIVGIGYTGWFTYRNLVFQPDREALIGKIKSTYKEITGSSN
ncbi:Protein CURVATURE THYLAKOID 1B chloroplastic [Zea mays]|uniref:Protein CURVATURE THYLAKOID 1B chloroplastic n=1 Tax=Zea mays TaxID=4577 RepID=A0A1D6IAH8_MAIZE|nr:Protein CURVATURE THYLAKOID 1B chloroplastic [Zea mays]